MTHPRHTNGPLRSAWLLGVALLTLVLPLAVGGRTGTAAAVAVTTADVTINGGLAPQQLAIGVGTTVTWHGNDGGKHRMRSTSGPVQFDSGGMNPGVTWSFTFNSIGTYQYRDEENKSLAAYAGTVTVTTTPPVTTTPSGGTTTPTGGTTPPATPAAVRIINRAFGPASISIATGSTVVWTNNDGEQHTVTERNGLFDSGRFGSGATFQRTFGSPGTYSYFCDLHPNMVGSVTVSDPSTGGTLPPPPPPPTPPTTAPPATGGGGGGGSTAPAPGTVNMIDYAFSPATLTVAAGSSVTWKNVGLARHTVAADDGTFHSPDVTSGTTWQRMFGTPGTYTYFCDIHPGMKGTILVTGAGGSPPPPPAPTTAPPPVDAAGDVRIADFSFSPTTLTVKAGTSLTFVNVGAARHSATAADGSFDTGLLARGNRASIDFGAPGTYLYFCTIHPEMTGTILVTGADGAPPPPPKQRPKVAAQAGDVQMVDFDFSPKEITISAGGSVRFVNTGVAPHTATARDGSFDTGIVRAGGNQPILFPTAGTFSFYCTIHPQMTAVVLVEGADGAPPPPEATPVAADAPSAVDVTLNPDSIEPGSVRVAVGGTVTWKIIGARAHVIDADDRSFHSPVLAEPDTFHQTFTTAGVYPYHDSLAPTMRGVITVVEPPPDTSGASGASADGASADIRIIDLDYDPREVTVAVGATVTWTNTGQAPHTVTDRSGGWTSDVLPTGGTFQHTFDTVGRYEYICTLHANMVGTIIVSDQIATVGGGTTKHSPDGRSDTGLLAVLGLAMVSIAFVTVRGQRAAVPA